MIHILQIVIHIQVWVTSVGDKILCMKNVYTQILIVLPKMSGLSPIELKTDKKTGG